MKRAVVALVLTAALVALVGCSTAARGTSGGKTGTPSSEASKVPQTTSASMPSMVVGKTTVFLDGGKVYDPSTIDYAAMNGEPSQNHFFKPVKDEGVLNRDYPSYDPKTFKFLTTSNSFVNPQRYYMFDKNGGTLNKAVAKTGYKFATFFDSGDIKILPNFYVGYYDFAWVPLAIPVENWSGYESRQQELWKGGDNYVIVAATYDEGDALYAPAGTTLKDLAGKKVGIMNPDYDIEAAFNQILSTVGLATQSAGGNVQISMAAPAFTLNDLQSQQYAASFARSKYAKMLTEQFGYREIANTDSVWGGRTPATVLIVRKDIIAKHPDVVQAVVQANYDATQMAKKDTGWQTGELDLLKAFRLKYNGSADNMRSPKVSELDAQASPECLRGVYDYMVKYGFFKTSYTYEQLVDDSFYQKVKK